MADAVLNGLTNNRHTKLLETQRAKQEREKQLQREASREKGKSPQAQTEEQAIPVGDEGTGRGNIGENSQLCDGVMHEVLDGRDVEEGGSVRGDISEGGSVRGDTSEAGSGEGVSETTSVQPEDVGSISGEESSSMELENNLVCSLVPRLQWKGELLRPRKSLGTRLPGMMMPLGLSLHLASPGYGFPESADVKPVMCI